MMMLSAISIILLMTSILSLTLEPPTIAVNGRSGLFSALPRTSELLLHQQAGYGRQMMGNAFGGSMRAVSRAECVVDEQVRKPAKAFASSASFLLFALRNERSQAAIRLRCSEPSACASDGHRRLLRWLLTTGLPSNSARASGYRLRRSSSTTWPFGRPRWLARITLAPFSIK